MIDYPLVQMRSTAELLDQNNRFVLPPEIDTLLEQINVEIIDFQINLCRQHHTNNSIETFQPSTLRQ